MDQKTKKSPEENELKPSCRDKYRTQLPILQFASSNKGLRLIADEIDTTRVADRAMQA